MHDSGSSDRLLLGLVHSAPHAAQLSPMCIGDASMIKQLTMYDASRMHMRIQPAED